ncbi:MAG TPA: glycosyltransferase [Candidatus Binatus sp.]|nr:glycosyltransferase [Candidatus Binatus sp.]
MAPNATHDAHRIGYVLKVFPRLSETFVINEIRELERQDVAVHVLSLHQPPAAVPHELLRELAAPILQVDAQARPSEGAVRHATAALAERIPEARLLGERLLPRHYVRLALQLAHAATTHGIERLHAHFASRAAHVAMLAGTLLDLPYSVTAHAKDIYHQDVDQDVLRVKMRRAALVITVSEFNRRTLLRIGDGIPGLAAKLVRAYNGVDLSLFEPSPPAERVPGRILAVGRLVEKKGFFTLIQACGLLAQQGVPFSCHLIGTGEEEQALRALVRALGLDQLVQFRGALPVERVAAAMRSASLVALPCVVAADGNVDALPTVLLEAMACGLPVVSTALSGIPEIVADGETGYLVPPGDAVSLAASLAGLLEDRALAERFGRAGRRRAAERFDLRANVARLRDWFFDDAAYRVSA